MRVLVCLKGIYSLFMDKSVFDPNCLCFRSKLLFQPSLILNFFCLILVVINVTVTQRKFQIKLPQVEVIIWSQIYNICTGSPIIIIIVIVTWHGRCKQQKNSKQKCQKNLEQYWYSFINSYFPHYGISTLVFSPSGVSKVRHKSSIFFPLQGSSPLLDGFGKIKLHILDFIKENFLLWDSNY